MTFLNYSNKLFVFVHSNPNLLAPNPIIETNVKKKKFWEGREDECHNWTIKGNFIINLYQLSYI